MDELCLDKFHEECGIFGIFGHEEASTLTQLGLFALQHRGQEACGIVSSDGEELYNFRSKGLIADVLTEDELRKLPGATAPRQAPPRLTPPRTSSQRLSHRRGFRIRARPLR